MTSQTNQRRSQCHPQWQPDSVCLTRNETSNLHKEGIEHLLQAGGLPQDPAALVALAAEFSHRVEAIVPEMARQIARLRHGSGAEALVVRGIPVQEEVAALFQMSSSVMLGEPFNYEEQLGGALSMRLEPKPGSAPDTNTTSDEFRKHSDDAAMPEEHRVTFISLLGIANPRGTLTGYSALRPALEHLPVEALNPLFSPRWQVRYPLSFNLGGDVWSEPRPLLSLDDHGHETIAWASYATRPVMEGDVEATQALAELDRALDRQMHFVAMSPGTMLLFSNARGVHMRTRIAEGQRRLVLRNYVRTDLDALRAKAGCGGNVFSLASLRA